MSVSVKTRFEVYKRDRFTCTYCGKHPPDVLLEVDHVVPRAAGGSDAIDNLTTACLDCNRGKGARMLEEGTVPGVHPATVAAMEERLAQTRAYIESLRGLQSMTGQMIGEVIEAWARAFHATEEQREDGSYWVLPMGGYFPDERTIRRFVRGLPLERVLEAVDITASRFSQSNDDAVRYFYGVGHSMIREAREHAGAAQAADVESPDSAYQRGREDATTEIGALLRNYPEHGWQSLDDAVLGLFPDED